MDDETLNDLIMIHLNGPKLRDFQPHKAVDSFLKPLIDTLCGGSNNKINHMEYTVQLVKANGFKRQQITEYKEKLLLWYVFMHRLGQCEGLTKCS